MLYAYQTLKDNSKRRGKVFELTFEEFKTFAIDTNYLAGKGRKKHSLHIDRIIESDGYTKTNIQILENHENVRKFLRYRWNGYSMDFKFETIKTDANEYFRESNGDNGCPF